MEGLELEPSERPRAWVKLQSLLLRADSVRAGNPVSCSSNETREMSALASTEGEIFFVSFLHFHLHSATLGDFKLRSRHLPARRQVAGSDNSRGDGFMVLLSCLVCKGSLLPGSDSVLGPVCSPDLGEGTQN